MFKYLAGLFLFSTAALAQNYYPPIDISSLQTAVVTAQTTANAAQATASAACVATPSVPGMEQVGGLAGTNNGQCRPITSVQPRITRAAVVTTDANGNFSATWSNPLTSAPTISLTWVNTTSQPITCELTATPSASSVQGRCKQSQTTNLASVTVAGISVTAGSQSINPFNTGVAGIQVHVIALPPAS